MYNCSFLKVRALKYPGQEQVKELKKKMVGVSWIYIVYSIAAYKSIILLCLVVWLLFQPSKNQMLFAGNQ